MTTNSSNSERESEYREAVIAYADNGLFTNLIDLLADTMHVCDESGEDFHYALCVAGKHHLAELNNEPTENRRLP